MRRRLACRVRVSSKQIDGQAMPGVGMGLDTGRSGLERDYSRQPRSYVQ